MTRVCEVKREVKAARIPYKAPTSTPPNATTRKEMIPRKPSITVTVPTPEYSSNRWYNTWERKRANIKKEKITVEKGCLMS